MGSARLLAGYFEEMTNGVVLEERVQVCIGCIGYPGLARLPVVERCRSTTTLLVLTNRLLLCNLSHASCSLQTTNLPIQTIKRPQMCFRLFAAVGAALARIQRVHSIHLQRHHGPAIR